MAIDSILSTNHNEGNPLLPGRTRSWLAMRYGITRKCVSSKAALLILLWSFVVGLLSGLLLSPDLGIYISSLYSHSLIKTSFVYGTVVIITTCLYPLAGILADIKYGRHKTVVTSLCIVLLAVLLPVGIGAVITLGAFFLKPLAIVFGVLGGIVAIMLLVGLIGFTANAVQFGMDQLHDSIPSRRQHPLHILVYVDLFDKCIHCATHNYLMLNFYNSSAHYNWALLACTNNHGS